MGTREQLMSIKGGGEGRGAVTVYATVIKFEWVPNNTYYLGGGGVYVDRCHLFLMKWVLWERGIYRCVIKS